MSRPHYSRRAPPHQLYTVAHPLGWSEQVQSTPPYISFRARIRNLVRRKFALTRSTAIDCWAPATLAPYVPYRSSASPLNPVPYAEPSPYSFHTYQSDTISTVSVEAQDEPSSPTFPSNITYAPRLSCKPLPPTPWTVPLIWMTFKHMELTCPINPNECLLILQDCPLLVDFKFTLAKIERNPPSTVPSLVEARALRSLTVHSFCGTERLFQSLRLPQLTSIHLSLVPLDNPPTDIGVRSLIFRSGCTIKTLSLLNLFLVESELIACLKLTTASLEDLSVRNDRSCAGMTNGRTISEETLQYLTNPGSVSKLKKLVLSPCVSRDGHLAQMLASRLLHTSFDFAYSFIDPSLHAEDIHYLSGVAGIKDLYLTQLIHEL